MAKNFTMYSAWGANNEIKSLPCQSGEDFGHWRENGGGALAASSVLAAPTLLAFFMPGTQSFPALKCLHLDLTTFF